MSLFSGLSSVAAAGEDTDGEKKDVNSLGGYEEE